VGRPKRRNRSRATDPTVMAASLPDDLRSFRSSTDPNDFRSHVIAVADWSNTQMPGMAEHLTIAGHGRSGAHRR
jgi:ADP-ribosylglycohydrolase